MYQRTMQTALAVLTFLSIGLWGSTARAANYETCFLWEYQVVDAGGGEDKYPNSSGLALAPGVTVEITAAVGGLIPNLYIADDEGCIEWSANPVQAPFTFEVFTQMRDDNSNVVHVNDAGQARSTSFSDLYSYLITGYTPPASGGDVLLVGDETQTASTTAMAAYSLRRYNQDIIGKDIYVGLEDAGCGFNSAHFPSQSNPLSNGAITSGLHWVSVGTCPDSSVPIPPGARRKFTIAHEMGHAILALIYADFSGATNGYEPFPDSLYSGPANTGLCADTSTGYGIDTAEFSSMGYREGFAHFVAARVFNNKAPSGIFQWFGTNFSLETGNGVSGSGGRLEDVCCSSCTSAQLVGSTTIGDWMRWLWDAHSNNWSCCSHNLTKTEVGRLYALARLQAELGSGYDEEAMLDAVLDSMIWTGADSCLVQQNNSSCGDPKVQDAAAYNGIDN